MIADDEAELAFKLAWMSSNLGFVWTSAPSPNLLELMRDEWRSVVAAGYIIRMDSDGFHVWRDEDNRPDGVGATPIRAMREYDNPR